MTRARPYPKEESLTKRKNALAAVAPRDFLLLHATLLLYAVVGVFAKLGGNALAARDNAAALVYVGMELLTLLVYTVLWQRVLRRMPLGFAYSNKGVCTLWTCLAGVLFFGEGLTWGKAVGMLVVLAGVTLVVTDHE